MDPKNALVLDPGYFLRQTKPSTQKIPGWAQVSYPQLSVDPDSIRKSGSVLKFKSTLLKPIHYHYIPPKCG